MSIKISDNLFTGVGLSTAVVTAIIAFSATLYTDSLVKEDRVKFELVNDDQQYRELAGDLSKLTDDFVDFKAQVGSTINQSEKQLASLSEQQQNTLLLFTSQKLNSESKTDLIKVVQERVEESIAENLELDIMDNRIELIETALVATPEKVLKLPLLAKDLGVLSKEVNKLEQSISELDGKVEKVKEYELHIKVLESQLSDMKTWGVSMLGGLFISIVSIGLGNIMNARKSS